MLSSNGHQKRISLRRFAAGIMIAVLIVICAACRDEPSAINLDLNKTVSNETLLQISDQKQFHFGIGSMITPKEGYAYYRQLIEYVAEKMGQTIRIVDRGTYDEINSLLEHRHLDAAFVCGGPYVDGKEQFGLELLALPEMENGPIYFSYLIVPATSHSRSLADLRGKVFAFADPKSNSGYIVPTYWLAKMGETPDSFFSRHLFTYAHDASIRAVMDNLVDGAAVDSLIWDYLNNTDPEVGVKTRIIKRSEAYGVPPLVVRPDLPAAVKKQLREIFLTMHEDREGKAILDGMLIKRFVPGEDAAYDSIRQMKNFTAKQGRSSSP